MKYAYRLFLDLRLGFNGANVTLNFTVECSDNGIYICKAYGEDMVYSGQGELRIRGKSYKGILIKNIYLYRM